MIESANGQSMQPSLKNQIGDAQRDSNQGKGSRKSSNQLSDTPHVGQKKTSIHEEDLKPEIKEIMVKISADLEKRKMTNKKMREEMSQFPALDFEEGSFSCQKDTIQQVDGNQPIRKTFMMSQEPIVLDFSGEDVSANDEKVKKSKPTASDNVPNEFRNEEVKISEQYLNNADTRFKRRNEENNNTNNSPSQEKQDSFSETNQKNKQQYDSSFKQNKQDVKDKSYQLHPQEKSEENVQNLIKHSNPSAQQQINPKKGSSLNTQQEQYQQQQQQQQLSKQPQNQKSQQQKIQLPYQPYLSYNNYQQKTQSPLKMPSNQQETQNISQQQNTQTTDPSNPSTLLPQNTPSFNKPSTKAAAAEPIQNLSKISGQIYNPLKNNSQAFRQGENSYDSNNLGDSRVSTQQNMVEKVQFLEKEIDMLNKENGLLRLKNDFLNNRLNEMHRQNSNLSNNNSFSGNNSQNSNNLFNNSNALQRSAQQSYAATPQHSALLKSTGNFNEPSSQQTNLPCSPSNNNNINLNYQTLNMDATATQSQTNTPLRNAQAMNNNNSNSNQMFFSNNQEGNNYNSGNTTKSYSSKDQDNQLNHSNILSSVCQLLQVESPNQLISAAQKYNRCIQSIPKLEQFVQNVYAIVLPTIPQQQRASKSSMQEVFRQIQIWRDQQIQVQQSLSQQKFYFEFYRQFSLLFNVDQANLQEPSDLLVALRIRLEEFNQFHKKLKQSLQMDPSTRDDLAFKSALDKLQQFSSYRQFTRNLQRLTGITNLQQLFQEIEKSLIIKSRIAPMNAHITLGRFE